MIWPGVIALPGTVDAWNTADPTTNAEWRQVIAVRVAVVARSTQYDRDEVTHAEPEWNVGTAIPIADTHDCGASKCLTLKVKASDSDVSWKHYRYRIFEAIVPLRNMVWNNS